MKSINSPAILGGTPIADPPLPFVRPVLPSMEELSQEYETILASGMVTTGPFAEQLGDAMAEHLGVPHATAVSSCTTGLLLAIQALELEEGAEVILPSFTFMASGLGPVWNRLRPVFCEVDRSTMNIDPAAVEDAVTPRTGAILATHQFGAPAPVGALESIAMRHGLALACDAAHGLGSLHKGKPLGSTGRFEAFSLSPTKLVIAAEGGIVATREDQIAEHVRRGRNYGNPGDYDCLAPGLNARMSELHAILALHSLHRLESAVRQRNCIADYYRERLSQLPGIEFQTIAKGDRSSYKDFCVTIQKEEFGLGRDALIQALSADGVHTRVYYQPVLHRMKAFQPYVAPDLDVRLPNTRFLEENSLCLPIYSDMREAEADIVCAAVERIFAHAASIKRIS